MPQRSSSARRSARLSSWSAVRRDGVAVVPRHDPQVVERLGDAAVVAERPAEREVFAVQRARGRILPLLEGQDARRVERLAARRRGVRGGQRQRRGEPPPPLAHVAVHLPEAPERPGEPQRRLRLPACRRPAERRPEIVVLRLQPRQPRRLLRAGQCGLRLLREREEVRGVRRAIASILVARPQPLARVFADRLQHPEAGLAVRVALLPQQALPQQAATASSTSTAALLAAADRGDRLQPRAAREDRQAPEERLLRRREQPIAPGDRLPQRPLPVRQVARAARQQSEPLVEPGEQGGGRQRRDPRRRQFDRQRQAVQPGADRRHRRRVLVGEREVRARRLRPLRRRGRPPGPRRAPPAWGVAAGSGNARGGTG